MVHFSIYALKRKRKYNKITIIFGSPIRVTVKTKMLLPLPFYNMKYI